MQDTLFGFLANSLGAAQVSPVAEQVEQKSIFDQAVLLSLELRQYGTTRKLLDEEYSVNASQEKTRASKRLLDSTELKAVRKFDGETRHMINQVTLPSQFRAGLYLLPIASLEKIDQVLRDRQEQRQALVDELCSALPTIKWSDALPADQGGLGALYKEADYPTPDALREAFKMVYSYTEFSAPGKLRSVSMAIYQREKDKASEVWRSAIEEGKALLRAQFLSMIEHMRERLEPGPDGKPKKFKGTLVANLGEFLQNFDARNLAMDEELAKLVHDAADMLNGVTPDDLRSSDSVKARVQAQVESIKASLDTMVGNAPVRAINLDSEDWGAL